jgi:hypothetical protein
LHLLAKVYSKEATAEEEEEEEEDNREEDREEEGLRYSKKRKTATSTRIPRQGLDIKSNILRALTNP